MMFEMDLINLVEKLKGLPTIEVPCGAALLELHQTTAGEAPFSTRDKGYSIWHRLFTFTCVPGFGAYLYQTKKVKVLYSGPCLSLPM
jgi:hypothetical protein